MKYIASLLAVLVGTIALGESRLIKGTPVPDGERPDIVNIRTGNAGCTATIVGKRVVITAAHCAGTGATSVFEANGVNYRGRAQRSPLYPRPDHDVAVIITDSDIALPEGKLPSTIGGTTKVGDTVWIYGYGCIRPGGGGGNDGVLRTGTARVTGYTGLDVVSSSGAALCYGDSGGPVYVSLDGKYALNSINSKGNIFNTNYTTRLDTEESKKFLEDVVAKYKVDICGVNIVCAGGPPPPAKIVVENVAGKLEFSPSTFHKEEYLKEAITKFMETLKVAAPH